MVKGASQITLINIDELVAESIRLKREGKLKVEHVDLGSGPADDYGKGKYTGD